MKDDDEDKIFVGQKVLFPANTPHSYAVTLGKVLKRFFIQSHIQPVGLEASKDMPEMRRYLEDNVTCSLYPQNSFRLRF